MLAYDERNRRIRIENSKSWAIHKKWWFAYAKWASSFITLRKDEACERHG